MAVATDVNEVDQVDASGGAGSFVHMGLGGAANEAPWVSLALGLRYFAYLGLPSDGGTTASPSGLSTWAGVGVPRLAGLLASVHYNSVTLDNGLDDFAYTTWQVRLVRSKSLVYFAFGIEGLLESEREGSTQFDEFGIGPDLRIALEFGLNLGGLALSE